MASTIRSQLTKIVPNEEHGISLSLLGLLDVLSFLIMSLAANALFAATASVYSGFSILLISLTNLVALIMLCYVFFTKERKGLSTNDYSEVPTDGKDNE